ncbi:MAG: MATE family efflux transporter [Caldisericia bacterium]|nr:MATE family efflux transporter [Caldisericia bacterium]
MNLNRSKNLGIDIKKPELIVKPILPALLKLSWPAMLAMLFQSLTSLTDVFFLKSIGTDAQAAIGIFAVLQMYLQFFNSIVGNGSICVISQHYGKGNSKSAGYAVAQTLLLKLVGSIVFTIPILIFLKPLLSLIGAEGSALDMAVIYGSIMCFVIPFQNTGYTFNTGLRAAGDAITPMYLMMGRLIVNLTMNAILVLGIGPFKSIGIAGVAISSAISQLYLFIVGMYVYTSKKTILSFSLKDFVKPNFHLMKRILQIGSPTGLKQVLVSIANSLVMKQISFFGMASVATFTVVSRITGFINMPIAGLSFATSTIVGQNVGAEKPSRAVKAAKYASLIALGITVAFLIVTVLMPTEILSIFSKDPVVIASSVIPLLIFTFNQIIASQNMIYNAPLLGTGYLKVGLYITTISTWFFQIPLLYLLPLYCGMNGIWYSFTVAFIVNLIMIVYVFKKRRWVQRVI